jgi:hypothetical protein
VLLVNFPYGGIMPIVALVLFAVFAALGFGWRS